MTLLRTIGAPAISRLYGRPQLVRRFHLVASPTGVLACGIFALAMGLGCAPRDRVVAFRNDASPVGPGDRFGTPASIALLEVGDLMQDPTLTSDELELYFAAVKAGTLDIWVATRAAADGPWDAPRRVDELSTPDSDLEPDVSGDGLTLHFASDRPAPDGIFRIWLSQRQRRSDPWGPPQPVGLGTSTLDRGPTVAAGGRVLVFVSDRDTGDFDLYETTRANEALPWGTPAPLSDVNTIWYDWDPALFRNGLGLVFGSRREGDHASSDLFETVRASTSSAFGAAEPLGELNTPKAEGDPWLSNDGRHVVFASERSGVSRLYEAWRR